jgi:hypothetical protein
MPIDVGREQYKTINWILVCKNDEWSNLAEEAE